MSTRLNDTWDRAEVERLRQDDKNIDNQAEYERLKQAAKKKGWRTARAILALFVFLIGVFLLGGEAAKHVGELLKQLKSEQTTPTTKPTKPETLPTKPAEPNTTPPMPPPQTPPTPPGPGADQVSKPKDCPCDEKSARPDAPLTESTFLKAMEGLHKKYDQLEERLRALENGKGPAVTPDKLLKQYREVIEEYRKALEEQAQRLQEFESLLSRTLAELKEAKAELQDRNKEVTSLKASLADEKKRAERLAEDLATAEAEAKRMADQLAKKPSEPETTKWFASTAPCGKAVTASLPLDGKSVPVLCAGGRVWMWAVDKATGKSLPIRELDQQELKDYRDKYHPNGLPHNYYSLPVPPRVL